MDKFNSTKKWRDRMDADAFSLSCLAESDRKFCLFIPKFYFFKNLSRYYFLLFLIVFLFVLSPFSAILLPVYVIILYKFYLFTVITQQFNFSLLKLWIAAGLWSILFCLPLSVYLKSLIIV